MSGLSDRLSDRYGLSAAEADRLAESIETHSAAEMPVQDVENQQYLKRRLEDSDDPDEPVQDADDL